MNSVFNWILESRKTVVAIFLAVTIVCLFLWPMVGVNYDFMEYLPESSPSTTALKVMGDEFAGDIPNLRAMVPDLSVPEALELKESLGQVTGVSSVMWLDDVANVNQPLETIDKALLQGYYTEGNALFTITIDSASLTSAVAEIEVLVGEGGALDGTGYSTAMATEMATTEVGKIIIFVVPLCFMILFISTTSWFEPLLFMVTIGVAIAINAGTNIIFGEISFITNAAGSILQLAVSMDYSIFLLHSFADFRRQGLEVKAAMLMALKHSVSAIMSSGLTTVVGFAALITMQFQIGPDMGYVMAKGIGFSLVTVLVLLPALTVMCYTLIDKTSHRPFLPSFNLFAKVMAKLRVPAVILVVLIIVPAFLAQVNNKFGYGAAQMFDESSDVAKQAQAIEDKFGISNNMVLLVPRGSTAQETMLSQRLKELPEVKGIMSYVDMVGSEIPPSYLDPIVSSQLLSENYSRMMIRLGTEVEDPRSFELVQIVRSLTGEYYGDKYHLAGDSVNTYDLKEVVTSDNLRVNIIAVGAILLILILTFKSITVPLILVLVIEASIWINLSFPYFSDQSLFYTAYLIISSIQLGATVDYAILFANRYEKNRGLYGKKEAVHKTITATAGSIITSAAILALAGFSLGNISTNQVIGQLGVLIGRGALLSTILVFAVLPALLYLLDGVIKKTSWGKKV